MDIVVTIPKSRLAEVRAEERDLELRRRAGEKNLVYFWKVSKKPAKLRKGDKMYFVWDEAVRAWHKVVGFGENMTCQHTGRRYDGPCIMLDPKIHEIKPIKMKGFRGFRYFSEEDERKK
jgi:hypothetical protein